VQHDWGMASLKNDSIIDDVLVAGFLPPEGLDAVAVYGDFASVSDAGLAILAMGKAYWTFAHEGRYVLCVSEVDAEMVALELHAISLLAVPRTFGGTRFRDFSFGYLSFGFYAAILIGFFVWQQGGGLLEAGRGDAVAMMEDGQWPRAVTALMLHGDVVHLVSNLVAGVGFAFCVARFFGAASGWVLVLLSGVLGNALNAWVYYPEAHYSIGASTAVFGALGLLTGAGLWVALAEGKSTWAVPRWFVPIFGGITLLGLIGIGDGALDGIVDVAAHISGFLCGLIIGVAGAAFQKTFIYLETKRFWVGCLSFALVAGAWAMRMHG